MVVTGEAIWIITNVVAPPSGGSSPYSSGTLLPPCSLGKDNSPEWDCAGVDTAMQQMLIGMMGSTGGRSSASCLLREEPGLALSRARLLRHQALPPRLE